MANRAAKRKAAAAGRRHPAPNATPQHAPEQVVTEPQALVVTSWFDPGADGEPYAATIRLTGRRVGAPSPTSRRDTFTHEEAIDRIIPGSGPMSISSWVYGLEPGEWLVTGELVQSRDRTARGGRRHSTRSERLSLRPASWSWRRWSVDTAPTAPVRTRWALPAPLARIPAVVPGSWPVLGSIGVIAALLLQASVLGHENISQGPAMVASALGLGVGLIGAKVWYAILHRGTVRGALLGGWAVDGFIIVTLPVVIGVLIGSGMPVGAVLDAGAPGLFLAIAIGRLGCFLTGCCAGRLTHSRWGIWSSDRRVGGRRIPAQLVESLAGLVLAIATWFLIHARIPGIDGATLSRR